MTKLSDRIDKALGLGPARAALAKFDRPGCDTCPHVDYLTVNVERHEHECSSCGETFTDAAREKRYFGKGPR
jgi:hypothetical protein